jgi:hypothetical protein
LAVHYRSPDQMADRLIELSGRHRWPFLVEQVTAWRRSVPEAYSSGQYGVLVPDFWLRDMPQTIRGLWAAVAEVHPTLVDYSLFDTMALFGDRLIIEELPLGWSVVNPLDNPGKDPTRVRTAKSSAGLQLLAMLAFQPEWSDYFLQRDDTNVSPRYWLPGLVARRQRQTAPLVPYLSRSAEGAIRLDVDEARELMLPSFAPTVRRVV